MMAVPLICSKPDCPRQRRPFLPDKVVSGTDQLCSECQGIGSGNGGRRSTFIVTERYAPCGPGGRIDKKEITGKNKVDALLFDEGDDHRKKKKK